MYKLLREILKELKEIRKELHIIASNTEPCSVTTNIHDHCICNERDMDTFVDNLRTKLLDSKEL